MTRASDTNKGEVRGKARAFDLLKSCLSPIVLIVLAFLCQQIMTHSFSIQNDKVDFAELNHVTYGIFNVDEWKQQVTAILSAEINKLHLSKAHERELRKHIETLLNTLIDQVARKIKEGNAGTLKGKLKQSFIDAFVNLDDIKKGIPEYTDAIIHEMTKAKTMTQIKSTLHERLEKYSHLTFAATDTRLTSRILARTGSSDFEEARIKLGAAIQVKHELIAKYAILMILLSIILFAWSGFSRQSLPPSRYTHLILTLILLLIVGVTTPMIDLEAKISRMSFDLMGHTIHFKNQVLYFQCKSILDVFWIMMTHEDIPMKLVGVLVIAFSAFIPFLKIVSSLGYYFDYRHSRENSVIKFFVFKSGKWSMADVMVVAIFMAYIGFNGIITSQFGQLSAATQELVLLTTNGTSLQPGYYLFLTYTLLALWLSDFLARELPASEQTR